MNEEVEVKQTNQKSFIIKLLGLIAIVMVCSLIGNGSLLGLGMLGGMKFDDMSDIFGQLSKPELKPFLKAGIGINHLFMFSISAILFAFWIKGKDWLSYFKCEEVDKKLLIKFLLLLFFSYPFIAGSSMILDKIDLPEWMNSMDESSMDSMMQMLAMDGVGDLLVNLLIVAILPAIGEELLFRGVIQNELIKKMANPHVAIVIASIIFSAFHLQVLGFLPKMILGLIMGYAYYWTKSLWYPMIIHLINNGLQTFILFLAGDQLDLESTETVEPNMIGMGVGVIISCFLCYYIINNIKTEIAEKERLVV